MEISEFEVKAKETNDSYGKFILAPLAKGYGYTLGNALRRVLISSLKGAAVTKVKIQGVQHRFSTLRGLKEDVLELLLNIKEIRFRFNGVESAKVKLAKSGPGKIMAGDIETPAGVEIVNKGHILGTLADKKSKLKMEMEVESGYGYSPFEERKLEKIGVLPVDSVFSPVQQVNYKVEATRVGRVTNLDRLIVEIWTDGTIKPKAALDQAARILIDYFTRIAASDGITTQTETAAKLDDTIDLLEVKSRIKNILKKADITSITQLTKLTRQDLKKIKNLGQKSVQEIKTALKKRGLELK